MIWNTAPSELSLPHDGIHVWRGSLALSETTVRGVGSVLTPGELARAAGFRSGTHRRLFIHMRAMTREILCRYLGKDPAKVDIRYGTFGKPYVPEDLNIRFNASRSGTMCVCVIARTDVGVDIEQLRSDLDFGAIAAQVFPFIDFLRLRSLPADAKMLEFFRLWTRTEALLKASGIGFSGLRSTSQKNDPHSLIPTTVYEHFEPAPGYVGALAAQRPTRKISYWQWA